MNADASFDLVRYRTKGDLPVAIATAAEAIDHLQSVKELQIIHTGGHDVCLATILNQTNLDNIAKLVIKAEPGSELTVTCTIEHEKLTQTNP